MYGEHSDVVVAIAPFDSSRQQANVLTIDKKHKKAWDVRNEVHVDVELGVFCLGFLLQVVGGTVLGP